MSSLLAHPLVLAAIAYLMVTALFQFRPFSTRALGLDLFGIVPRWKFFIPQPGRFDVSIAVRCGNHDGDMGDWTPLAMFPPRHALSWLWSPGQHRGGMLWLSAYRLAMRAMRGDEPGPEMLAYRTLARHAHAVAAARQAAAFQFAVRHEHGSPIFSSRLHDR